MGGGVVMNVLIIRPDGKGKRKLVAIESVRIEDNEAVVKPRGSTISVSYPLNDWIVEVVEA